VAAWCNTMVLQYSHFERSRFDFEGRPLQHKISEGWASFIRSTYPYLGGAFINGHLADQRLAIRQMH
jgi:hypothetical protein